MQAETVSRLVADLDNVKAALVEVARLAPDTAHVNVSLARDGFPAELDVHGAGLPGIHNLEGAYGVKCETTTDDLDQPKYSHVMVGDVEVTFYR